MLTRGVTRWEQFISSMEVVVDLIQVSETEKRTALDLVS